MNEAADRKEGSARVVDTNVRQQLDTLLAGMGTHLDTLRAGVVRAEADVLIKRALCEALPVDLPLAPEAVRVAVVYKADAEMTFSVTTRDQALSLIDALPGVPLVVVEGGCTTFIPEERFVEDARSIKASPVGDVVYRLSTWCGHLQEEYSWWTRLADRLVHIKAVTPKGILPEGRARGHSREIGLNVSEITWDYAGLPSGTLLRWFGGDHQNVAPLTVHQARGVSFKDAAQTTQTAIAKVTKDCCAC